MVERQFPKQDMITGVALIIEATNAMIALPKPFRHGHLFAIAALIGIDAEPCLQGFTDEFGQFVTRRQAGLRVFEEARDIYSEDLW